MNSTHRPDCILHIGMHKTGTSSIQQTLSKQQPCSDFEFINFGSGGNSSSFFYTLFSENAELHHINKRDGLTRDQIFDINKNNSEKLKSVLENTRSRLIIISGEGVSLLEENEIYKLKEFLDQYCKSIRVIGYVRSPISYVQSSFQQNIKNGFVDIEINRMAPGYRRRFEKFDNVFGKQNVFLFKYDISTLWNNDVVLDFCQHFDIEISPKTIVRVNDSLSLEATSLLYVYYKYNEGSSVNRQLIKIVSNIGKKKVRFSSNVSQSILKNNLNDIRWMEIRLGCSLSEALEDSIGNISSTDDLLALSVKCADDLKKLLLCNIPKQSATPQKVADWMRLLGQQLSNSNSNQQVKTVSSTAQIDHLKAKKSPMQADKFFRLILHIGAGETDSSSIQEILRLEQKELVDQGFWYLGRMMEHAPVKRYSWQKSFAFERLISLSEREITAQLTDVLSSSVDIIVNSGCRTAILSNESFFNRPKLYKAVIPVLEQLTEKGWEIEIIAYVRRHDAWLKSAYTQWGLKHKSYPGQLLPFSEWIKQFNHLFSHSVRKWMNAKGCKSIVHNFDVLADVVDDFYTTVGIPQKKTRLTKVNECPSNEELLLRSLFNNQIEATALPYEFDRLMEITKLNFNRSASTFLSDYLPSDADLTKVVDDCAEDRAGINRILQENGQPPLDTSVLKSKPVEVDLAKLAAILFEILANQARKIERLESKINSLTKN